MKKDIRDKVTSILSEVGIFDVEDNKKILKIKAKEAPAIYCVYIDSKKDNLIIERDEHETIELIKLSDKELNTKLISVVKRSINNQIKQSIYANRRDIRALNRECSKLQSAIDKMNRKHHKWTIKGT